MTSKINTNCNTEIMLVIIAELIKFTEPLYINNMNMYTLSKPAVPNLICKNCEIIEHITYTAEYFSRSVLSGSFCVILKPSFNPTKMYK